MKSAAETLARWKRIDAALSTDGLHVATFAAKWGVCRKTIWRDLKAFADKGHPVEQYYTADIDTDNRRRVWRYSSNADCWWVWRSIRQGEKTVGA